MELLNETTSYKTQLRKGEELNGYLQKVYKWIEDFYRTITLRINWLLGRINKGDGVSGTFTTVDGKTVTVENGIITSIS